MGGRYVSGVGGDVGVADATFDFCVEVVFLVFWFFSYDFEFCEFFGGLVVCALFGRAFDVDDERMHRLDKVHFGVLVQFIVWVVTCSIEASETDIHSMRAILKFSTRKQEKTKEQVQRTWVRHFGTWEGPGCQSIACILHGARFGLREVLRWPRDEGTQTSPPLQGECRWRMTRTETV
jgi:hypothetical protein